MPGCPDDGNINVNASRIQCTGLVRFALSCVCMTCLILDFRDYAAAVSQARRMAWISAGVAARGEVADIGWR